MHHLPQRHKEYVHRHNNARECRQLRNASAAAGQEAVKRVCVAEMATGGGNDRENVMRENRIGRTQWENTLGENTMGAR